MKNILLCRDFATDDGRELRTNTGPRARGNGATLRLLAYSLLLTAYSCAPLARAQTPAADLIVGRTLQLGALAAGTLTPAQITVDQNNYAPTGYATALAFRISSDAARTITGWTPPSSTKPWVISVENVGAFTITLSDENASSTAANRFDLSGGDYLLTAGSAILFKYDATATRWRLIGSQAAGLGAGYQPLDADLTSIAALTTTAFGRGLLDDADAAAGRTSLGVVIGTNVQAYDADLTTYAGITPSANVQAILGGADYAAIKTLLSLTIGTDVQAYDADLNSIAGNTTGGFLTRTAGNTYTARTITGTAAEITVTNGDGVSGVPTLSLPTALTFTGKTVTGGTFASPALTTPTLGVATATSINKVAITAPATSATLTLADGSTLATSGAYSTTFTVTGATTLTLPTTGTLAALGGTNTWSGVNTFSNATAATSSTTGAVVVTGGIASGGQIYAANAIHSTGAATSSAATETIIDYFSGNGRIIVNGPDVSTNAGFLIYLQRSDSSNTITAASWSIAGAMTIPSTLTTAGGVTWDFLAASATTITSANKSLHVKVAGTDYYIPAKLTND